MYNVFHIEYFGWNFIVGAQHGNDAEANPFLLLAEVRSDGAVEYAVDGTVRPERMGVNVMIDCRNCQHGHVTGAVFCAECGEPLGGEDLLIPAITEERITEELRKKAPRPELAAPVYTWLSLHFVGSGKILPLASRNEFILGRLTEDSPILPDVDLTPYRASGAGVSRLHAVVKREANQAMVMDLGSSNGTYINGQRIRPDVDVALSHQDIIALGALQIQVLLHDM